ncbi:MAG: FeoB-associated Cys-rich membrane protein [Eubacteriales bacterium]|nr:FeoB-associated Cys-rich membrane protein [Eubacteriales bacterium]
MNMADLIVIAIIAVIVGSVIVYLYRARKRGETCIGCPYAKQAGGCHGGCHGHGNSHVQ